VGEFPELLDVKGVAVLLGVSAKTVYELIWRGEIECYRVHRRYRFSREQVHAFLNASVERRGAHKRKEGRSRGREAKKERRKKWRRGGTYGCSRGTRSS
jgi:excisionase family DNA binding protein